MICYYIVIDREIVNSADGSLVFETIFGAVRHQ